MSYLVLARKYRPQSFEEVVGQKHITQTLTNAIISERVAHAILFSGPRGTGKTTIARILAKILNCSNNKNDSPAVPCNTCESCKEITSGHSTDVFEIDGASNNSVDQVRELRENAKYMPSKSPYKIYIIDEVHMLSTAAFNALLKILEEPPAHVKFMFATTEPHKIPITIMSRCQRHDLRRIDINAIIGHMANLSHREQIEISTESLNLIALEADGSMRDSLSLLDQVMSCSESPVTHDKVLNILGSVDRKTLFELSHAILTGDMNKSLEIIEEIYNRGQNIKKFYSSLIVHFRNLLISKIGRGSDKLIDAPIHELNQMSDSVSPVSEHYINQILNILFKEENGFKYSSQPKLALEITIIKLLRIKPAVSIETIIDKIDTLRNELYKSGFSQSMMTGHPQGNAGSSAGNAKSSENNYKKKTHETEITPSQSGTEPSGAVKESVGAGESEQNPDHEVFNPKDTINVTWSKIINLLTRNQPAMAATLSKSNLIDISGNKIEFQIAGGEFIISRIKKDKNMSILKKTVNDFFKMDMEIVISSAKPENVNLNPVKKIKKNSGFVKQDAVNHPLVTDVIEILNGTITNVKII